MTFYISGLYAGLTGLLLLVLSAFVVAVRAKTKVGIGDGQQPALVAAMRAQGNLIEYAPLVLLLLVMAEAAHLNAMWLHIIGVVWLVGRMLHAFGMIVAQGNVHPGRLVGILLTWITLLVLSLLNCWYWAASYWLAS
ncbi:MAPEG family protein [Shewanella sp. A3A]|nr:MAPEG family protein [Shewanella ferrihydritica]